MIRAVIEDKAPQPTIKSIIETLKRTERELDTKKKRHGEVEAGTIAEAAVSVIPPINTIHSGYGHRHQQQQKLLHLRKTGTQNSTVPSGQNQVFQLWRKHIGQQTVRTKH